MSGLLLYRNFPTSGKNTGISEMSTVQKPHGRHNGRHGFFSMISTRLRGRKGHVYRSSEKRPKLFLGSCSRRPCFRKPHFSELELVGFSKRTVDMVDMVDIRLFSVGYVSTVLVYRVSTVRHILPIFPSLVKSLLRLPNFPKIGHIS